MSSKLIQSSTLALALAAATLLGACSRDDTRENVRTSDSTVGQQGATQAQTDASKAVASASNAAGDMAITAAVKTLLAADTQLSAMAINVDTSAGRVALRGTAPDTTARTRATEMARSVAGVVDVDNTLTVQAAAN